jgi:hypothetical protein
MKHIKSNYSALELLKTAKLKLHKEIISKCVPSLLRCLYGCTLNVLEGNVKLSTCTKRKLRTHNVQLQEVADKRVSNTKYEDYHTARRFLVAAAVCSVVGSCEPCV